jgi:hypothetical protein
MIKGLRCDSLECEFNFNKTCNRLFININKLKCNEFKEKEYKSLEEC